MASNKRRLPRRFEPHAQQAQTETALRYGAQESGLKGLFDTLTSDYQRNAAAQQSGYRSALGTFQQAPARLNQTYTDAGLTPEARQQFAGTPDGQRLLAQLARDQSAIQQQELGLHSGQQFIQQRLADDYRSDVGRVNDQRNAMLTERGLFESSRLGQLIGDDRGRRSEINSAARKQRFDADQAILNRQATQDNALIGQGLLPDADGNLQPLPGGKADPKSGQNKPKKKQASQSAHTSFSSRVEDVAQWAKRWPNLSRAQLVKKLQQGRKGRSGWADAQGNPVAEGTPGAQPYTLEEIPSFKADLAMSAALDIALDGTLGRTTQQRIQAAGYSIGELGLPSFGQRPRTSKRTVRRPGNAPGAGGQSRPT